MLLNFTVENWMSFREKTSISMIASKEQRHKERISRVTQYPVKILPIAAIYGGNASGKTNFFKALNFVKRLVVRGTQPDELIPVESFCLDAQSIERPTHFLFEILIDDTIYEFSFAATKKAILEEKLVEYLSHGKERVLYARKGNESNFHDTLNKDEFLHFAFKGTRDNQLFLTNAVSQKVENFKPIYDWFKNSLQLIAPDSRFGNFSEAFFTEEKSIISLMNTIVHQLDTGINRLGTEEIPVEDAPLPEELKKDCERLIKEGKSIRIGMIGKNNKNSVVARQKGKLIFKRLVTYHTRADGTEMKFEVDSESDGSQRIIDLLPEFLQLFKIDSKKVYVIDELDRSLHTLLVRKLLEEYLSQCGFENRSQLLFTTHDVLLMDRQLFRLDEMWIAERSSVGASNLYSFCEYKEASTDKHLQKSYLQGRLGGIPRIFLNIANYKDG